MNKILVLALLSLLAACGGDDLVLPSEGSPASISVVAGDDQSGRAGSSLATPIVVQVIDSRDRPVAGVDVAFEFDGGPGSGAVPTTVTTDADGHASVQLVLGTSVGEAHGVAKVAATAGAELQADFTATILSAMASELRGIGGDGQSGQVGTTLAEPLTVEVTDAFDNPIAGVTITWTVEGGGSTTAATTVTGADGRTSVQRSLGPTAGPQGTRASSSGLAGSPVAFTHTATAAGASRITIVSGNNQTGPVLAPLPQNLVVQVLDAGGNPVAGTGITWVVTAGGGTVAPATSTTDGSGQASTRWTLGSAPGANTVDAVVSGIGTATFTATATAGASASLAISTQPPATATLGVAFNANPVIQLRDAAGNEVQRSGVAVTAAIASGGGTLAGTTTRSTDGSGRATFNDLRITGATGSHTLIFAANGHTSVTSSAINVQQGSTTTSITSDAPDPSTPGQAVTVAFAVTSSGSTPSGTVTVTASGGSESCSASVAAGSCALTLDVGGDRTLTATYGGDALLQGSSDTESHRVASANRAPTAANDAYTTLEGFERTLVIAAPGALANDVDPDGNQLRAGDASDPPHGQVTLNQDGSFSYNPDPDYSGDDSFTYRASDGSVSSNTATVAITVSPINDPPSFRILGGNQTAPAEAVPQQVPGFAEFLSPGAPNEQGQILEFLVEIDPSVAALFSQAPAISPDGTLTYVPAGTAGTATVTVRARDNGGIANGGQDTSAPQTFTITLTGSGGGGGDGDED